LPNKGPQVRAAATQVDLSQVAAGYATLVESATDPWRLLVATAALTGEDSGPATPLGFKTLEQASADKDDRDYWKGKRVKVTGQFAPSPASDRIFSLVRFRIRCCAADAIQLNVPMISKESVSDIKTDQWVEVTGRISFQQGRNGYLTVLHIPNRQAIASTNPDPNPWAN
jgi:hypothetical protein